MPVIQSVLDISIRLQNRITTTSERFVVSKLLLHAKSNRRLGHGRLSRCEYGSPMHVSKGLDTSQQIVLTQVPSQYVLSHERGM